MTHVWRRLPKVYEARELYVAFLAVLAVVLHVVFRYALDWDGPRGDWPLFVALALGGGPMVLDLARKAVHREFGSDLLAGISIVTAVLLGQYLAGTLVVLMLSGGRAVESFALERASSALRALAARVPSVAHKLMDGVLTDIETGAVQVGDLLIVLPHEIAPVDGEVIEGHGVMDESYLTGEPYMMSKAPGSQVLSGAINGDSALTIRTLRPASDSRYAKILQVMREAEENRPKLRRLGDQLGAFYTPVAVIIAASAWWLGGDPLRFLAVMVIATPCPLLIAIPVAIIGAISRAAQRGIIIRSPAALELIPKVRTVILDKTGTLTYGRPTLTHEFYAVGHAREDVLPIVAALESYSKHPLAGAIIRAAGNAGMRLPVVDHLSEAPGEGLSGTVGGVAVRVTGRDHLLREGVVDTEALPPSETGLECIVLVGGRYVATYRFHDAPRDESAPFVAHLGPKHRVDRILLVSGDREAEVRYLAKQVAIDEIHAGVSPEGKVEIVRIETARAKTLFLGDGINDAPAMLTATVGVAFGSGDVTSEAASVVIVDPSLGRVDELLHISQRMRRIALQSAVGGMALSVVGMLIAAAGYLPPVAGAVAQEVIDLVAVFNALRVAAPSGAVTDF